MDVAAPPHAPHLDYRCEDPGCCDNGCPVVTCRACGQDWPCPDWRSRHTEAQIMAQFRYVARKWYPNDPDMVEYSAREDYRAAMPALPSAADVMAQLSRYAENLATAAVSSHNRG